MKDKIRYYYNSFRSTFKFSKYYNTSKSKNFDCFAAELIRYTHSIEKGLSIKNVKLGFGHSKQRKMIELIGKLSKSNELYHKETIKMAISALNNYISFHDEKKFNDEFIDYLRDYIKNNNKYIEDGFGGTTNINKDDFKFNVEDIENFFNTRHSIRDFSNSTVNIEDLKKALTLAQKAPSACNRQGVRAYIIEKEKLKSLIAQLSGVGGFAGNIDKIIIITGKLSSYRYDEINQYIVSASIYAGYLTMTLHLYGIGACVIQRTVVWNKQIEKLKREYGISNDEQIICMIGIGNYEGEISVPISKRISFSEFVKFVK